MTNFDFLRAEKNFATFADACIEAEKSIGISPALCALGVRKSAELAVKWLYSVDSSLRLPYKDNFSALVYNPSFTAFVDQNIINNLRFIIKLGNFSAHTTKKVAYREAVLSLQNLFEFILFIDYCYGSSYEERDFDETLLASEAKQAVSAAELTRLREKLETRSAERAALASEMKSLQEELAALRAQNAAAHSYVPHTRTEEETRRTIIDIDLRAMGWTFDVDCMREVPVIGLPNDSGKGFADYVLYGRDHKPLAVVEAKKTSVSPEAGREQARLYADCLEQMTGQRPLIFYTNGYDTYFWDDLSYPPRQVYSVFSQDDLVRIIRRRTQARGFDTLQINAAITDRAYQKEAIHSVCSAYAARRRKALLVMATGTGKTRTVISLVDVLLSQGWMTNVLFLADRTELVRQAKQAFTEHLPNLSTFSLLDRGSGSPTARAIFSTYPTILNAIDEMRTKDGARLFTPGHFDLIVIDEAHRSIFKKYRAIFRYFDALIVGLTATPKTDVDHNTYDFFDMGNFAFFAQNPKSIESAGTVSLAEKAFGLKVRILQELQNAAYQTKELSAFRAEIAAEVHAAIAALNKERFEGRAQLAAVDKYAAPAALEVLDTAASEEIIARLAPLIPATGDDESARRLDVIVYRMLHARRRIRSARLFAHSRDSRRRLHAPPSPRSSILGSTTRSRSPSSTISWSGS